MRAFVLVTTIMALACGPSPGDNGGDGDGDGDGDVDASTGGGRFPDANSGDPGDEFADARPTEACGKMDILFVIDNSGSMAQEQTNLANNFPEFINVLDNFENPLDYRVAITSTGSDYNYTVSGFPASVGGGDNGEMLQRCNMPRRWLENGDADRVSEFQCAAQLGTSGPADEMPLRAMRQAFGDRVADGTNNGFRRDDALLAMVIITDENDCSYQNSVDLGLFETLCQSRMEPVGNYKVFMDNYAGGAERWAVAVIAGETDCSSELGDADEATRLKELVQIQSPNSVMSSICEGDLAPALNEALQTFETACNNIPID